MLHRHISTVNSRLWFQNTALTRVFHNSVLEHSFKMALHSEFTALSTEDYGFNFECSRNRPLLVFRISGEGKTEYGEWQRSEHGITECGNSVYGMKHASGNGSEMI